MALALVACYSIAVYRSDFKSPKTFDYDGHHSAVTYLEHFPVDDTSEMLDPSRLINLVQLFIDAERYDQQLSHQSHFIKTSTPIVKLLFVQFPELKDQTSEGGKSINMSTIANFLMKQKSLAPTNPKTP